MGFGGLALSFKSNLEVIDWKMAKKAYIIIAIYLAITALIGLGIIFLSLDRIECEIVFNLQDLAQKTLGIQFFQALTYLGDFYIWMGLAAIFFFYTYFKSRNNLKTSIELAVYLILITASTYLLKDAFARPRPHCANITIYDQEASFSYPSGHVSRATGAFIILARKRSIIKTAAITMAIFLLSLTRIVLGAHFPTDILGAIFLSLAMNKTTEIIAYSLFKY